MTSLPGQPIIFLIDDISKVGEARRTATALASRLEFDETERGKVAIVATEVATNLCKHAREGELFLTLLEQNGATGLEILALDRGPGMTDIERCLSDGYSTAGSPGNGLGASSRLASSFDIHSIPDTGTVVMARFWKPSSRDELPSPEERLLEYGVVVCPAAGEEVCGDAWAVATTSNATLFLLADGLGHGPQAAEAAQTAVGVFRDQLKLGPAGILQAAHLALKSTRGAAMAVAQVPHNDGELRYAGVGNISGAIKPRGEGRGLSMVSQNGTVGHVVRKLQEFVYPWTADHLLIMHSDGLASQWHLERYPGITLRHPSLSAGVLYRDHKRGRDDVTVLVARASQGRLR